MQLLNKLPLILACLSAIIFAIAFILVCDFGYKHSVIMSKIADQAIGFSFEAGCKFGFRLVEQTKNPLLKESVDICEKMADTYVSELKKMKGD